MSVSRVVCVGGDGMFSEILHGLVTRTQMDHGVDQNQSDAELVPCSLRIGIIPAGELFLLFHRRVWTQQGINGTFCRNGLESRC